MKPQDRFIDAKISILQLAQELQNISKACKVAGITRSSFYEIKKPTGSSVGTDLSHVEGESQECPML